MRRFVAVICLAAVAALATAAVGADSPIGRAQARDQAVRTVVGETKPVGDGEIRAWFTTDQAGKPLAIGVTFTEDALSGLPDTEPTTEYQVLFPPQASVTPFTHFVLNWNPKGHIPAGIYDVPHFDFHFYIISPEERTKITATGDDLARVLKAPPAGCLPPGYITAPGAYEPRMGNHYVDAASPEFHGKPFTITFVYGSYDGKVAFLEPMITKAFLETKQGSSETFKLPQKYPTHAYYPTRYALRYDPAGRKYIVALQGFVMR